MDDLDSINKVLALDMIYKDDLTIRAPIDGELIAPQIDDLMGSFLPNGKAQIGMVATMDDLRVKGVVDANDAELPGMVGDLSKAENQIRLVGDMQTVLHAKSIRQFPGAVLEVPPALGPTGGGQLEMDPKDPKGMHPKVPQFIIELALDNPKHQYIAGQRAYMRFTMESRPLMWQWERRFWQLIQVHDTGKWL
jgi:hypothetical protein